ncbi:MAG: hypothetical protein AB9861_11255 [Methanosarcina sp.]
MLPNAAFMKKEPKGKKGGGLPRLSNSESAAVTAIAAVLLLALVFTVFSVVRIGYVPEWKSNAEQNHMYDTWDDMVGVKTRVDILSTYMDSGNYSAYGLSATVPFNLGGGEVPVFEPSKSDGKLEVNTERCAMTITPLSPNQTISPYTFECGGITCYSENRQYPDQIFRYENGALILANDESSLMKQPPVLYIKEDENRTGSYTFLFRAVQLLGKPYSVSSNTIVPLRLTGWGIDSVHDSQEYENLGTNITGFNLTIATKYPDAWASYFNETAQNQGFEYGKDYMVEYLPDSDSVRFSFLANGSKALERLYVSKVIIGAELGPGSSFNYANYGTDGGTETTGGDEESGNKLTHGNRIILNKQEIGGIITSGTYIQFKNNKNNNYWVEIDGSQTQLKNNDIVRLVIDGDQTSGAADMNSNTISNFNFNVEMYIDGKSAGKGKVTGIWVAGYSDYESTLTYKLPSYLSDTQLRVDGNNLISSWPANDSAINLYNIGPSTTNNNFLTITFNTSNTYFDCSADYEIINT